MRPPDIILRLSWRVQSRNEWTNQFGKAARWKYLRYKTQALEAVKLAMLAAGIYRKNPPMRRAWIEIKSIRTRKLDADNCDVKCLIDAMRHQGIIENDTPDHLVVHVTQVLRGTSRPRLDEGTEVWIWQVDGSPPECWQPFLSEPPPPFLSVGQRKPRSHGRIRPIRTSREPRSASSRRVPPNPP